MSGDGNKISTDLRQLAEIIADVLVERGLIAQRARILDAAEVAELLRRDRSWVYQHADELGAFRYGDGPKARLGFDLERVEQWKRDRAQPPAPQAPRSASRGRLDSRTGAQGVELIPFEPLGD
jgi:predicted DNA-binding transcriptional regulator AlpA